MRPSAMSSRASSAATNNASANNNNYAQVTPETDLASPCFDAKKYLASIHGTTSFSSLQTELKELKRATSDKTEQLKALVSQHFDQYLSCHEAVRALSDDIRTHAKENDALLADMKTLKQVTDSTLSVMLQRAKEQRRIRNTIAVLNRFRPIFEITTKMKECLQNKDYEKLAEDYCRLKLHQTKANIAALQPVLAAAHEIAKKANIELLKHFDDVSLSVKDQKRAITVLEAIGLTEKPALTCLLKQFGFLEAKLEALQLCNATDPSTIVMSSAALINRFRSGLWGYVCDVFKSPNNTKGASSTPNHAAITSAEAESIQQKAWAILSKAVDLIEKNASPPSAAVLKQLNETFREINSLKKCTNATQLNANIAQLKSSFCDKFRVKIVLQFVQQTCTKHREKLMNEYFEPLVSIQSLGTEPSLNVAAAAKDTTPLAPTPTAAATKVSRLIDEASTVFDELRNMSMVSSESKVKLTRASVFTTCAQDVIQRWEFIWKTAGSVLLLMADGSDSSGSDTSAGLDAKTFRALLAKELKHQLHSMLSAFMTGLVDKFSAAISPPSTMASVSGSRRNREGPAVCVLFAIVANCIELREKNLSVVETWLHQLSSEPATKGQGTAQLRQLLLDTEAKCMDKYVKLHADPLLRVLQAESAEESQPNRAISAPLPPSSLPGSGAVSRTESMRLDSRTASLSSFDFGSAPPVTPTSVANAVSAQNSIPQDSRQYVFNVLLQLINLSSEVESSLGHYPQCQDYVRTVTTQLTLTLSQYLKGSVDSLKNEADPSEWRRIHLLVEVRFFLFALRDHLTEDAKIQFIALEKQLEKTKPSEKVAMAQIQLLAQLKHQTKLYLLALQQA